MAKKKGIRQSRQDYIKRDLRELKKLGYSMEDILNGRTIESLAYTQKSYDNYRKNIRKLKKKARTNQHRITFTKKQYEEIRKIEKDFTELKSRELERIAKQNNLNALEIAYLKGKEIMSNKFQTSLSLPNNFGKVKLFDYINKKDKVDEMIEEIKNEMDNFVGDELIDDGRRIDKLYLQQFEEAGFIDEDERQVLKEEYEKLSPIEKAFAREKINYLSRYIYTFVNDKLASSTPYHELAKIMYDVKKAKYQIGF